MRARWCSHGQATMEGRSKRLDLREKAANSLFWKILQVSHLLSIFCGCPGISRPRNIRGIMNLAASPKKIVKGISIERTSWANVVPGVNFLARPPAPYSRNWQLTPDPWQLVLRTQGRVIGHAALVVAQRNIHEDVAKGGLEADHQRFGVFTGLVSLLRRQQERGMHAEMEALVVERGDGVAHDLVGEFKDGFFDQRVRLGQFGASVVAGHLHGRL